MFAKSAVHKAVRRFTVGHSLLPEYRSVSLNPLSVLFNVRPNEMHALLCVDTPNYVGYSESKYRLRISLAHPRDCHFAHVQ